MLPAKAQFWGNSWGVRQQQPQQPYNPYAQQPYNHYGGFGGDREWGYGDYRQWGPSSPRQRDPQRKRPREVEKEQPPDYSHAPPTTPRKDATVKVVVMGDANADWLAFGLEDAFSEKPEIGIVRKHHTDSGLIRYDQRRDSETEPEHPRRKGKAGGSVQPMAGPVVPLTGANVGLDQVLLGGPGESPGATVGLSAGQAVAAPSGRADDFSWPRGVVNGEPAASEPAAPDTAAADAGAKSAQPAQHKSAMDAYAAQTGREHKPAQRRPRPRLNHHAWAHQRPNSPSFGSSGW